MFKQINDLIYYQGGYPSENSPAKIDELIDDVAATFEFFELMNNDQFVKGLSSHGLKIEWISKKPTSYNKPNIEKLAEETGFIVESGDFSTPEKAFMTLINHGQELQGEICAHADIIKLTKAAEVQAECNVKKNHFVKSVKLKANAMKVEEELKRKEKLEKNKTSAKNSAEAFIDAIAPITVGKTSTEPSS